MNNAEPAARPRVVREVEHKFRIHGLFRVPDLQQVAGVTAIDELGTVELESTYFDTPDLRLAREGITLRRRTGDDEGWHLKLPAAATGPEVRDEFHLPLAASSAHAPPSALIGMVRPIVRDAPVGIVSILRTERTRQLVHGAGGVPVAELVDDTVHVLDNDRSVAARFRELELEVREGGKVIGRIATALTAAGAVSGEFVAKAVRSLGPAAAAPPEVAPPSRPGPKDPARDTLIAYLATNVRALRAADLEFRRDPSDHGDAIHQLRVSARRLRSGLRTFRPLLEADWTRHLRTELGWAASSLTDLRESEVLRDRLAAHLASPPVSLPANVAIEPAAELIHHAFHARLEKARAAAEEMLDTDRYVALHGALVAAAVDPETTQAAQSPARDVLPGLVRKAWKELDRQAENLRPGAGDDLWHATRLAAKRARYAAEAAATSLGPEAAALAGQIQRLTDILGEHQDAVQAAAAVQAIAGSGQADADVVFVLGALAAAERGYADAAQATFDEAWADVRRPRWRKWLST
ncbi:MAG TPA: CYTH and CHAD domain-containing protein [Jiangellaceae bacterium]|nr:CYTH and CHAD domain-containing protein [Jiangellaceae bacterium]